MAAGRAKAAVDQRPGAPGTASAPQGRRVLAQWVAEPGPGVRFESEGALKVLFAENGTKQQLLATIDSVRHDALAGRRRVADTLEFLLTEGPPYPNRIHQSVLGMDLVLRITTAVVDWADLTEQRRRLAGPPGPTARCAAAMDLVSELHARRPDRRGHAGPQQASSVATDSEA